jgi:hypothetical protein
MEDWLRTQPPFLGIAFLGLAGLVVCAAGPSSGDSFRPVPLSSRISGVQPMTGIVMWEDSENSRTDAIALEYSYLRYDDVVKAEGEYDWSVVERKLNSIASRGHQAVLRFYETWPGRRTTVPAYVMPSLHGDGTRVRAVRTPGWSSQEGQETAWSFHPSTFGLRGSSEWAGECSRRRRARPATWG